MRVYPLVLRQFCREAIHHPSDSCHDSQSNIWDEIQDNESDFVDRKELKIYFPHRILIDSDHLGVYLAPPIPYHQDFHRSEDEKSEIDDCAPSAEEEQLLPYIISF